MGRILLALLVLSFSPRHVEATDGCGTLQVKCGQICTGQWGTCKCGADRFNYKSETWCCGGNCTLDDPDDYYSDVTCAGGEKINLTQPCSGQCNSYIRGISERNDRHHTVCAGRRTQCAKTTLLLSQTDQFHCVDRSDLKKTVNNVTNEKKSDDKVPGDNSDNIDLTGLMCTTTDRRGDPVPGLKCHNGTYGCRRYLDWCDYGWSTKPCPLIGEGRTDHDPTVCSNQSFWYNKTCNSDHRIRCSSKRPGQCVWPDDSDKKYATCLDGSHLFFPVNQTCEKHWNKEECEQTCDNPGPGCSACSNPDYKPCNKTWKYGETKNMCYARNMKCDGYSNCDDSSDEDNCKDEYRDKQIISRLADFECTSPIYGEKVNISSWAVKCDGVSECWEGLDESDCHPYSDTVLTILYMGEFC